MEETRIGIPRSPSARQPAQTPPQHQEILAPRRNTASILEQMTLAPNLNMSAQRVTINSPIVTTAPAASVCYVCRGQGHTASCCFFAAIHQVKLRPVWCGATEQARREAWIKSGTQGPYPFQMSPPFAPLHTPSAETPTQTNISFAGHNHYPEPVPDDDETVDEQDVPQQEEIVEDLRYQAEQRTPLEVPHQQPQTWQEIEERGKDLQRQGHALVAQAKGMKKRADLEKEVEKEERLAEEALERAEKSRKRLRELK